MKHRALKVATETILEHNEKPETFVWTFHTFMTATVILTTFVIIFIQYKWLHNILKSNKRLSSIKEER